MNMNTAKIEALRDAAGRAGDNEMAAICEIALTGELSPESIEGLTDAQHERVVARFGVGGGWNSDAARAECERVIAEHE